MSREKGSPWAEVLQPRNAEGALVRGSEHQDTRESCLCDQFCPAVKGGVLMGWSAVGGGGEGGVSRDCVLVQTQAHSHGK